MALFESDFQAIIILIIIGVVLFGIIRFISSLMDKSAKISLKQKMVTNFALRIVYILVIVFMLVEGFPLFEQIDPTYTAVITGAISTAVAFASSGIFANLISGIVLMVIRTFDVGDLVKIEGDKGVVRSIKLTKIIMETFDNILIEKSNSQVISSTIVNYTIKLGKLKRFRDFKKKIQTPNDKAFQQFGDVSSEKRRQYDQELRAVFDNINQREYHNFYIFTFRMHFPFKKLKLILEDVDKICQEYKNNEIFLISPRYEIIDFALRVTIKFRLLTFNIEKIFDHQPVFAEKIYKIIQKYKPQ